MDMTLARFESPAGFALRIARQSAMQALSTDKFAALANVPTEFRYYKVRDYARELGWQPKKGEAACRFKR
jgi:hypothetical protein